MITRKNFSKGDQVLLYDSKLHLFPGKLRSRWTGPFIVQETHPNGSIDLLNPNDNRVIKVNGQRVKLYVVQQSAVKVEILLLDPPSGPQATHIRVAPAVSHKPLIYLLSFI